MTSTEINIVLKEYSNYENVFDISFLRNLRHYLYTTLGDIQKEKIIIDMKEIDK